MALDAELKGLEPSTNLPRTFLEPSTFRGGAEMALDAELKGLELSVNFRL